MNAQDLTIKTPPARDPLADIIDAFSNTEPLVPELAKHLTAHPAFGTTLRHPLVQFLFFHDALAKHANLAYASKAKLLREADEAGDFDRAVFLHERPWRLQALAERAHKIPPEAKGKLLGEVWRDSEYPHVNTLAWRMLWFGEGVAVHAMDEEEAALFKVLQRKAAEGTLTLWRGTSAINAAARGMSWTTDYDKAVWFARREGRGHPVVWEVKPPPHRIFAYMDGRGEREVIVDTKGLRGIRRTRKGVAS